MSIEEVNEKYGLKLVSVEENVYKNENPDTEVNADKLKVDLGRCVLVTSGSIRKEKEDGFYYKIERVYYALLKYKNMDAAIQYIKRANSEYGEAYLLVFPEKASDNSIGTLWSAAELGRG